jgi:hypothetical protein
VVKTRLTLHSDPELRKLAAEVLRGWQPSAEANSGGGGPRPASRQASAAQPPAGRQQGGGGKEDLSAYLGAEEAAELARLQQEAREAAERARAFKSELAAEAEAGGGEAASLSFVSFEVCV